MTTILQELVQKQVQTEPIFGREDDMVQNSAGGYSFPVDNWERLDRFLVLGTENGTYYISPRDLTKENVKSIRELIKAGEGMDVVKRIVEVSMNGLAPKNDQAIFALAICASCNDLATKQLALGAIPNVIRTSTHLFQFADFLKAMRGFGRSVKRSVSEWYTRKTPDQIAYQVTKYRQRNGWSHRDILRLTHPKVGNRQINDIMKWVTHRDDVQIDAFTNKHIQGFEELNAATTERQVLDALRRYTFLTHEMIPTQFKTKGAWDLLLLGGMPMTALVRNLATMTRLGTLAPMSDKSDVVARTIMDHEALRKARVHPIQMLTAMMTYNAGYSNRGSNEWVPIQEISEALEYGFYQSFTELQHLDKKVAIGIDVSGSMWWNDLMDIPDFTPAVAAGALAMVFARQSERCYVGAFSDSYRKLPITRNTSLGDAVQVIRDTRAGGTDCALPMIDALENKVEADLFIVLTDNETWAGSIHPTTALRNYRRQINPNAKLVVVAMQSNGFSIADPDDAGMMDVVGFDASVPNVVYNFAQK